MPAEGIQRLTEGDEIAGDELRALVDELVEGVLPAGARLPPEHGPSLVIHAGAVQRDVLAVRLHRELLEIRREAPQVLVVREDGDRLRPEEVVVPQGKQTHEHGQVAFEGRRPEVLVHGMEAREHGAEVLGPEGDHGRETDGRGHRVPAAEA